MLSSFQQLRHENLVNLIEVFRRKKRLYLVFEFVDHTVLDDLEKYPQGLDEGMVRRVLWQVLKGIEFCHLHNIIHRDIKPENILVSRSGIVKLCDFGFARTLAQPGEAYTDYVATRWYRSPELLVGDTKYGRAVDIWAVGCLLAEMLTGEPLFPGDSDIDQLFHIVRCFGNLTPRHREVFHKNPLFVGMRLPEARDIEPLEKRFPRISKLSLDLMKQCLHLDANDRPTCSQLLRHEFFTKDGFAQRFQQELKSRIQKENQEKPLLRHSRNNSTTEKGNKENSNHDDSQDNKDAGGRKKKKKDIKDGDGEKIKRKLPDPEKFIKKSSPPVSNPAAGLPAAMSTTPSKPVQNGEGCSEPATPLANDKVKKGQVGYNKKNTTPNQPVVNLASPQPILQAEKTSLHEKTLHYDKMTNTKKWNNRDDGKADRDKGGLSLPEVKGAEGQVLSRMASNLKLQDHY
ncbi:hypothetical protein LSH36_472g00013 [Paralvinella palmiformis]|uniref:Protein kinase domain-containing protein n=1 Tax=Paralvinella palmiformis TaxID=53620 RepID=A0AAD9MX30_9ANNE|nr:hypothetical protein LSH36_472g00013 [Paralvinella palmiformis]